jgi:hypothetical protein
VQPKEPGAAARLTGRGALSLVLEMGAQGFGRQGGAPRRQGAQTPAVGSPPEAAVALPGDPVGAAHRPDALVEVGPGFIQAGAGRKEKWVRLTGHGQVMVGPYDFVVGLGLGLGRVLGLKIGP